MPAKAAAAAATAAAAHGLAAKQEGPPTSEQAGGEAFVAEASHHTFGKRFSKTMSTYGHRTDNVYTSVSAAPKQEPQCFAAREAAH